MTYLRRALFIALACGLLAGCNTIAGVGQDVSSGARRVQSML